MRRHGRRSDRRRLEREWAGLVAGVILTCSLFLFTPVCCQEQSEPEKSLDSIEALIEILRSKGVISDKEAGEFIERHRETGPEPKEVITIVPEEGQSKEEVEKIREDLDFLTDEFLRRSSLLQDNLETVEETLSEDVSKKLFRSEWAQRIRWGGDIRLRYQGDYFDNDNALLLKPDEPTELMNTREDRERFIYRVRLAVKAEIPQDPDVNVGKIQFAARLTAGNEGNPLSTNDILGDYLNKDNIVIDRAYLEYTYKPEMPVMEKIPEISLTGGRIPNPWFYTDLVWDNDLNFEGFALDFKTDTLLEHPLKGFLTVGAFPLQEVEFSSDDKWLYGGQIGAQYTRPMGLSGKLGVAYHNYENIVGEANDPLRPGEKDYTAPLFQQKGNTLFDIDPSANIKTALASDYELINVTGMLDYDHWFPIHIILVGDYVKNLGFDRDDVAWRTGNPNVKEETDGYQVGLQVGYPTVLRFGEWNVFLYYKYLEADAVVDAFTDSDFHLGGTNAKGWILGGEFGLLRNVWLRARWLTADEISGPKLATDVLQIDLSARF